MSRRGKDGTTYDGISPEGKLEPREDHELTFDDLTEDTAAIQMKPSDMEQLT